MRRACLAFALVLVGVGCPRRGADEHERPKIAPDPIASTSTSSSTSATVAKTRKNFPPFAPFASESAKTYAFGDDVAWIVADDFVGHTSNGGDDWTWTPISARHTSASLSVGKDGAAWLTLRDEARRRTSLRRFDHDRPIDITPRPVAKDDSYADAVGWSESVAFTAKYEPSTSVAPVPLLSTRDGGTTWTRASITPTSEPTGTIFFPLDANHVWALTSVTFPSILPGGSLPANLDFTDDGGVSWKRVSSAIFSGKLSFRDAKRGWLVTDNDTLLRTDDGGATWTTSLGFPDNPVATPRFVGSDGVVVGVDRLYWSGNDGRSWSQGALGNTQTFAQLDLDTWWIANDHTRVFHSNFARTPNVAGKIPIGQGVDQAQIVFSTPTTGWATMDYGDGPAFQIFYTHDGGATWSGVRPPPENGP